MIRKKQALAIKKNQFEMLAWEQKTTVIGVDEVGRGCLAGPLVTAAVMLPIGKTNPLLKDSKIMDLDERLKAYAWIIRNCAYQVAIVHNRIIDEHNIWQATLIAMKKAVVNLLAQDIPRPSAVLVDAMPLKLHNITTAPVYYFPKGERKSSSIAAASIVAKVTRDILMEKFDAVIPGYKLGQHKGYSTSCHMDAIIAQRHSIIHRVSFLGSFKTEWHDEYKAYEQQTLC